MHSSDTPNTSRAKCPEENSKKILCENTLKEKEKTQKFDVEKLFFEHSQYPLAQDLLSGY